MVDTLDWINGDMARLRDWRASRPEVMHPDLPEDVMITMLVPKGGCPGGLSFHPSEEQPGAIVYFHGGSFCVGSPETHRINCAWIAHLTRRPVYSIGYRLAPEFPLPAQADDAVAAVRRQLEHHRNLQLMGDSAGGMVALWAYAGLTPPERQQIDGLLLAYPAAGLMPTTSSTGTADEADGLGPQSLKALYARLDPQGILPGNPRLDPLCHDFPALPKLTLLAAGADPMLRDAEALAKRHPAHLLVIDGYEHGFLASLPCAAAIGPLRRALQHAGYTCDQPMDL